MAYIQFLSEKLHTIEEINFDILQSAFRIKNIGKIYYSGYGKGVTNIHKDYIDNVEKIEEEILFLRQDINTYNEYLKFSDEENPCVILNAVKGKRLISLFSADKVRCKRLVYEFAKEYLKLHPENYLLIDQTELYDLKRIESLD